jgi:hypothetical protein
MSLEYAVIWSQNEKKCINTAEGNARYVEREERNLRSLLFWSFLLKFGTAQIGAFLRRAYLIGCLVKGAPLERNELQAVYGYCLPRISLKFLCSFDYMVLFPTLSV